MCERILSDNGRILVGEHYDPQTQEPFYRPIGGGIEFGEHSREAITREALEGLGASVANLRLLATLENIFVFNGRPGHEIVQVYDGEFEDEAFYQSPTLTSIEDSGAVFTAVWKPLSDFTGENAPPLYPDGLLELLMGR
ncbi:MAG: NUDIX hydrolase [Chloroflexi bacterium]|nr:NUDIX hydrolase [Chloroflexota bacterium]